MIVISNSTALMHLSAMGQVGLLRDLFSEVVIPEEVYQEVAVQGAGKPGAAEVQAAQWIKRQTLGNKLAFSVLNATLGAGESACIVLASEMNADLVILDDGAARLQAQAQSHVEISNRTRKAAAGGRAVSPSRPGFLGFATLLCVPRNGTNREKT